LPDVTFAFANCFGLSDVGLHAYGVMTAEVDFARSRISAQATDFYQLDTDALNATGDVVNAGAIEGRISVDGPILRGATANGSGLIMGALTDLDGESVATTGVASARFGNAGGALLVIEKAVPQVPHDGFCIFSNAIINVYLPPRCGRGC